MSKTRDAAQQLILDGLRAGLMASVFSGLPSITACVLRQPTLSAAEQDALFSLSAVGNVIFTDPNTNLYVLYAAGLFIHLFLSHVLAVVISYLTRNKVATFQAHLPFAVLVSLIAHLLHLVVLPLLWSTPLLTQLLVQTGHAPHLGDHLAFAFTVAFVLAERKQSAKAHHD